jgi:hypothetical protein
MSIDYTDPTNRAAYREQNESESAAYNAAVIAEIRSTMTQFAGLSNEMVISSPEDGALRDALFEAKKIFDNVWAQKVEPLMPAVEAVAE